MPASRKPNKQRKSLSAKSIKPKDAARVKGGAAVSGVQKKQQDTSAGVIRNM